MAWSILTFCATRLLQCLEDSARAEESRAKLGEGGRRLGCQTLRDSVVAVVVDDRRGASRMLVFAPRERGREKRRDEMQKGSLAFGEQQHGRG